MRKTTPWTARLTACLLATAAAQTAADDRMIEQIEYNLEGGNAITANGGYWRDGPKADQILQRLDIGITDLLYKLEHGYRNDAHGRGSTHVFDINNRSRAPSFRTTIPLWTDVLQPFHQQRQAP